MWVVGHGLWVVGGHGGNSTILLYGVWLMRAHQALHELLHWRRKSGLIVYVFSCFLNLSLEVLLLLTIIKAAFNKPNVC